MKGLILLLSFILPYLGFTGIIFAQAPTATPDPVRVIQVSPPGELTAFKTLQDLITNSIQIIFIVAALAVFVMLIWGAIEWIVSTGDKDKIANARKKIVNALIGLALLALTFLIINYVGLIIGFNPLGRFVIPTP